MEIPLFFILAGVLGGLARAFFGLLKTIGAGFEIKPGYFLITLIISGVIGGLLGIVFNIDIRVAGLSGYVGTDILENIFKSSMGTTIILKKK